MIKWTGRKYGGDIERVALRLIISLSSSSENSLPRVNWTILTPRYPEISKIQRNSIISNRVPFVEPWKPSDVLNSSTLATIYRNNMVTPNIELFPEVTEGSRSMSGRCGLAGKGSQSRISGMLYRCVQGPHRRL